MISAAFTVNGASNPAAHSVAYGSTVTLQLLSYVGATNISWSIVSCSDADEPIPSITESGTPPGRTATFVMPADSGDGYGRTFLAKCLVISQIAGSSGATETAVEYAVIGAANARGILPIAPGEENYRHGTHGWAPEINIALKNTSSGSGSGDFSGPGSSVNNNLVAFSGTTGKVGKDSLIPLAEVIRSSGAVAFTADQSMGSHKITSLADGTASTDAVTKGQLDSAIASGISTIFDFKNSARAATTGNITLSSPQTIDGVSIVAGDRVLVKNQTTGSQNGIYVAASGAWTRATDADVNAEVTSGLVIPVTEGTVNGGKAFMLTTVDPIVVGTTSLTFQTVGSYSADGTTLTLSGTTFSITNGGVNTTQLANDAVTYPKMQNTSSASVVLGRGSASGAGDIQELTCTNGVRVNGTQIEFTAAIAPIATLGTALQQVRVNSGATALEYFSPPSPVDGGNLTNADVTKNISNGTQFTLPASTLATSAKTLTLGTSGTPETDEIIEVIVYSQSQNYIIANGGPAGGTLYTVVAGTKRVVHAKWNGADWTAAGKIRLA